MKKVRPGSPCHRRTRTIGLWKRSPSSRFLTPKLKTNSIGPRRDHPGRDRFTFGVLDAKSSVAVMLLAHSEGIQCGFHALDSSRTIQRTGFIAKDSSYTIRRETLRTPTAPIHVPAL